jgi:hypothetical protein
VQYALVEKTQLILSLLSKVFIDLISQTNLTHLLAVILFDALIELNVLFLLHANHESLVLALINVQKDIMVLVVQSVTLDITV